MNRTPDPAPQPAGRYRGGGVREAAVVSGGLAVQQLALFATGVILARGLGPAGFGEIGIFKNLATILTLVAPLGLDLALLKHSSLHFERPGEFKAITAALRRIVVGTNIVLVILTAAILGDWLSGLYPEIERFTAYAIIAMIGVVFASDIQILGAIHRVTDRVPSYFVVVFYAQPVVRLAGSWLLVSLGHGVETILWLNTACSAGTAAVLWTMDHRRGVAPARPDRPLVRMVAPILSESVWMALSLLGFQLLRLLDVLVLGALASVAAAGQYAALSSVAQIIQIYPAAISQTLGPRIAAHYRAGDLDGIHGELARYLRLATILGGYLFGGVAVFGADLDLLFGPEFRFPIALSVTLAAGWYVSATLSPFGYALSMTGHHRQELLVLAGGSALLLVGLLLLVPPFAGMGAAVAVLIASVALNLTRLKLTERLVRRRAVSARHLGPALLFLALAFAARETGDLLWSRSLPLLVIECVVYTVASLAVGLGVLADDTERRAIVRRVVPRLVMP